MNHHNRIKLTRPVIATRLAAETLVGEIASLIIQQRQAQNELDAGVTALRDNFRGRLAALDKSISEKSEVARAWAEAHPEEFGGLKSLDMTHAVIGWRIGQPQLKTLSGWTWDRVLEKLRSAAGYAGFIRTKEEVDKAGILGARESLLPGDFREMGVRVLQEESFFIEPKLSEQEERVTVEG